MRLYSSAFLSLILLFFALLKQADRPFEWLPAKEPISLETIRKNAEKNITRNTMRVHTDFTCAPCRDYALSAVASIRQEKEDQVEVIAWPLQENNEVGWLAATAAVCAGEKNRFWEMHDALFTPQILSAKIIREAAKKMEIGEECLSNEGIHEQIKQVREEALGQDIREMPMTLIGPYRLTGKQPIENVHMILKKTSSF